MQEDPKIRNAILAALTPAAWERMRTSFAPVSLRHGEVLTTPGKRFETIRFPVTAVASTVAVMHDGAMVEMATAGREGIVEMGAVLGSDTALTEHIVQIAGRALALSYEDFCLWRREVPEFAKVLACYGQANYLHILHTVACNARHSVEERAARWLLACHDRSGSNTFPLTQEFLAQMLGVSRGQVNVVARDLQRVGLIRSHRGAISIADRDGLEATSCECYGLIRRAFDDRSLFL